MEVKTGNEPNIDESETVEVTGTSFSENQPPTMTEEEDTSKRDDQEETIHAEQTHRVETKPREDETKQSPKPDDQTERVQTTTETEYETVEGGVKKHVKSSVSELKEYSHKIHRTVFNDSPDSTSANVSELSEIPQARPRIPVTVNIANTRRVSDSPNMSTVRESSRRPVFIQRTVDVSGPKDVSVRIQPGGTPASTSAAGFVPVQLHEELKRSYEREIAELKSLRSLASPSNAQDASKEELTRHILQLESNLRETKNLSDMISEEMKASRKEYELMLTKNVHLEHTLRSYQEKLKEYKTRIKHMEREVQQRESLLEKFRESHNRTKHLERYVEKLEAERRTLIKDYELLRQSHSRKEQQLLSCKTECADMIRKVDNLEYDNQLLEYKLMEAQRVIRTPRYVPTSASPRRRHIHRSGQRITVDSGTHQMRSRSLPFGASTPVDQTELIQQEPTAPAASADKLDELRATNDSVATLQPRAEEQESQTLKQPFTDNQDSVSRNADTPTVNTLSQAPGATSQTDTVQAVTTQNRTQNEARTDDQVEQPSTSPAVSSDLNAGHHGRDKPRPLSLDRNDNIIGQTDSFDEEFYRHHIHSTLHIPKTYEEVAYPSPSNYHEKRRKASEYRSSRGTGLRYRRPTSAYGYTSSPYTAREFDLYPSPLPLRSTTSLGQKATVESIRRPDRDFSRIQPTPVRPAFSFSPYATMSPDPFRYKPSRAEIGQLEAKLDSLKRKKRHLEKQYEAMHSANTYVDIRRRREELWDKISQSRKLHPVEKGALRRGSSHRSYFTTKKNVKETSENTSIYRIQEPKRMDTPRKNVNFVESCCNLNLLEAFRYI